MRAECLAHSSPEGKTVGIAEQFGQLRLITRPILINGPLGPRRCGFTGR